MPSGNPEQPFIDVTLKFGYISYEMIITDKNRALMFTENGEVKPAGIAKIIYSGYINNCINKDVEAVYEVEDFSKQLSSMSGEDGLAKVREVIEAWVSSNDMKAAIDRNKEQKKSLQQPTEEKNVTGSVESPSQD